jgi:hypothetical protein
LWNEAPAREHGNALILRIKFLFHHAGRRRLEQHTEIPDHFQEMEKRLREELLNPYGRYPAMMTGFFAGG